jgi:hypothetical protein
MAYKRRRKKKGKGDSVWQAQRTKGECALSGRPIKGKDQHGDNADWCLFLKCDGDQADPDMQIVGRLEGDDVRNTTPDGRLFRSVPTGRHRCARNSCLEEYSFWQRFCNAPHPDNAEKTCRAPTKPIFKWQEGRPTGNVDANGEPEYRWHDVNVWEHVVMADEAEARGFHVPCDKNGVRRTTEALPGERTVGHANSVSDVAESPIMDIARAAIPPEELGQAPEEPAPEPAPEPEPEPEPVPPAPEPEDSLTDEDREWLASL